MENSLFFALPGRKGLKLPEESFRIRCQIIPSVHENAGKGVPMEHITSRHNPLMGHIRKLAGSAAYRRATGNSSATVPSCCRRPCCGRRRSPPWCLPPPLPRLPEHIRQVQVPEDVMASISPVKTPSGGAFHLPPAPASPAPDSHRPAVCAAGRGGAPPQARPPPRGPPAPPAHQPPPSPARTPPARKGGAPPPPPGPSSPPPPRTPEELAALLHRSGLPL